MSFARKIFFSTASQIIGKLSTALIALITLHILASYFTPAQLADYGTIYSLLAFFAALADMGIYTLILRDMSSHEENAAHWYSKGVVLRFLLALVVLSVSSLFLWGIPQYANTSVALGFPIAAIGTFFILISGIVSVVLQYTLKMHYAALALILGKMCSFLFVLLVTQWWFPSTSSLAFYTLLFLGSLGSVIIFLITFFFARQELSFSAKVSASDLLDLFKKTLPFGISAILAMFYFQMGMLSFRFLLEGEARVLAESQYFIVLRMIEVLMYFPVYFMASMLPSISKSISQNLQNISSQLSYSFLVLCFLAFPIGGYLFSLAPEVIHLIAPMHNASAPLLQLSAVSLIFAFWNGFVSYVLIAFGEQKMVLKRNFLAVCIGAISLLFFVPHFQMMGAAYATLLAEVFIFLWGMHRLRKISPFPFLWGALFKLILASLFCTMLVFFTKTWLINLAGLFLAIVLETLFSGVLFLGILFLIGFFTPEMKKIFSK